MRSWFNSNEETIKHDGYIVTFMMIDPALAKEMLQSNTHNRPLKPRVNAFVRDMMAGHWQFNGDTIRISKSGVLLDGQHRLNAIKESGTTQLCLVVYGLDDVSQDTMDQGSKRSAGDQLHLDGHENAQLLSAVSGILVILDKGLAWARSAAPTLAEKKEFIDKHPDIYAAVKVASKSHKRVPAPGAALGAAYWLCAQKDKAAADVFFVDRLIEKLGLTEGDPARALSNRFERIRDLGVRIDSDEVVRFSLMAWNHWRSGNKVARLQAPKGGWNRSNFPHPK